MGDGGKTADLVLGAPAGPGLHTWIDDDGRGIWHYCAVCRSVRHPNGKIDGELCPGERKRSFVPESKRKAKPTKSGSTRP